MKIFMDDIRSEPAGFTRTRSVNETLELIRQQAPEVLSLDNDLGDYAHDGGDGFNVVNALAEWVFTENLDFFPDTLILHTSNPVERENMAATAKRYAGYSHQLLRPVTLGDGTVITAWFLER